MAQDLDLELDFAVSDSKETKEDEIAKKYRAKELKKQESYKKFPKKSRIIFGSIAAVGLATTVAGSVMLGISLSSQNKEPTHIKDQEIHVNSGSNEGINKITLTQDGKEITSAVAGSSVSVDVNVQEEYDVLSIYADEKDITSVKTFIMPDKTCNLFVKVLPKSKIATITFAINPDQATIIQGANTQKVEKGTLFKNVNKPTFECKNGYKFIGWSIEDEQPVTNNCMATANIEKTAGTYTMTFEYDKTDPGITFSGSTTVTFKEGQIFNEVAVPFIKKVDTSFLGWSESTVPIKQGDVLPGRDLTLKPVFKLFPWKSDEIYTFFNNFIYTFEPTTLCPAINLNQKIKLYKFNDQDDYVEIERSNFDLPVFLGPKVTSISDNFLINCSNFNSAIDFSQSALTSIGNNFLSGCTKFNQEILLGNYQNSITELTIGENFMKDCESYNKSIDLSTVKTIPNYFMNGTKSFEQWIKFNPELTTIGDNFMIGCADQGKINFSNYIPHSITTIGNNFFKDGSEGIWTKSEPFNLPKDLQTIGNNFISNDPFSFNVKVDENAKNISQVDGVIYNKDKTIAKYVIGTNIEKISFVSTANEIAEDFLSGIEIKNINEIDFNKVSVVNANFLSNANASCVTTLKIPNINTIGTNFCHNAKLGITNITIPACCQTIGSNFMAFDEYQNDCSLTNVTIANNDISNIAENFLKNQPKIVDIDCHFNKITSLASGFLQNSDALTGIEFNSAAQITTPSTILTKTPAAQCDLLVIGSAAETVAKALYSAKDNMTVKVNINCPDNFNTVDSVKPVKIGEPISFEIQGAQYYKIDETKISAKFGDNNFDSGEIDISKTKTETEQVYKYKITITPNSQNTWWKPSKTVPIGDKELVIGDMESFAEVTLDKEPSLDEESEKKHIIFDNKPEIPETWQILPSKKISYKFSISKGYTVPADNIKVYIGLTRQKALEDKKEWKGYTYEIDEDNNLTLTLHSPIIPPTLDESLEIGNIWISIKTTEKK